MRMNDYKEYERKLKLLEQGLPLEEGQNTETTFSPEEIERIMGMSFAEYRNSGLKIEIRSRLLGESIVLIPRPREVMSRNDGVVMYAVDEIAKILSFSPEEIRHIHNIKKQFGGTIIRTTAEEVLTERKAEPGKETNGRTIAS